MKLKKTGREILIENEYWEVKHSTKMVAQFQALSSKMEVARTYSQNL